MSALAATPAMRGAFTGFTRLSKAIAAVLVVGFVFGAVVPKSREFIALVPARTIPFAWNVVTAGYLETSVINVVVNILALLFLGKLVEPIWGSREFLKFILVVNTSTAMLTWALMISLYYVTQKEHFLYAQISGFHGVVAGFLVALKQLLPDQELSAFFVLKFRAKWIPSLFVVFSVTLCAFFGDPQIVLPFIVFGTYTSWVYLRFLQAKSEGNLKGDPSDEFAFHTFFPEFLRPVVGGVAWIFHKIFCGRRTAVPSDSNSGFILGGKPLPGSDPVDASRRRERGARALEERLNATKAVETKADVTLGVDDGSVAVALTALPVSVKPGGSALGGKHDSAVVADDSV